MSFWETRYGKKLLHRLAPSFTRLRWATRRMSAKRHHVLPARLVVSLTSHPPRYPTLGLTLKCLLTQTVTPDLVILWLAPEDLEKLPQSIRDLERDTCLEIRTCRDFRSYNKIVPTLADFPDAFVVTADDDVFYPARWLEQLVASWSGNFRQIVCHRARRITRDAGGNWQPYKGWPLLRRERGQSTAYLPTGVGGVLYPPGSLDPEVLVSERFTTLCPNADDLWLYWMGRRAGATYLHLGFNLTPLSWRGSQEVRLGAANIRNSGNDVQVAALGKHYGFPSLD